MERSIPEKIQRIIGPLPGQREARAFGVFALIAGLVACGFSLYYGSHGENFMGHPMGSDFVQFYVAGQLANQHQPSVIYDIPAFSSLQHQVVPEMSATQMHIFGYPPVVAELFRPFALLPYWWSYCAWLAFSLTLYASGLWLLLRSLIRVSQRQSAFLLALSAPMYTLETWIGGQLSVLAFFAVVLFIYCFENRWPVWAGLALGLATYKPSLVVIPAAMMIVGGCWRMLAGLSASSALMILGSFATAGVNGFGLWIGRLRVFSAFATSNEAILRRTKYVDLNSFFTILLGASSAERALATVATLAAFLFLAWTWWRCRRSSHKSHDTQRDLWAATLTWALMINVYAPVYDTILLVPAAALVARSVESRSQREQMSLQVWLIALWLVPWLTQSWADYLRLQILTPVLAGFGYWALTLARDSVALRISVPREDAIRDAA
jgi:glycosyl transferase family 87